MKRILSILACVLGTASYLAASAAPTLHRIECPVEIARKTIQIVSPPAGWTPFVPHEFKAGLPLHSAGLMWGPPSSMAISIPPIRKVISKTQSIEKWDGLSPGDGEKWIACFYGENRHDDAILSKRIEDGATECTVTYTDVSAGAVKVDVACKW
jgi:hypothetical protein